MSWVRDASLWDDSKFTLGWSRPSFEEALCTSTYSLSLVGGSSSINWNDSPHLGSLFFLTCCMVAVSHSQISQKYKLYSNSKNNRCSCPWRGLFIVAVFSKKIHMVLVKYKAKTHHTHGGDLDSTITWRFMTSITTSTKSYLIGSLLFLLFPTNIYIFFFFEAILSETLLILNVATLEKNPFYGYS